MNEPAHVLPPYTAESVPFPRAFIATLLLTLINVFNYMDRMVFAAVVQPLKQELGLTDPQIGFLTGFAFIALYAAIMFPLARWADRPAGSRVFVKSRFARYRSRRSAIRHDKPEEKRGAGSHHRLYRDQGRSQACRVRQAAWG